jgi:hypothetical protein
VIDDLFTANTLAAARDRIANPLRMEPPRKASVWREITALPRGITEAAAQVGATVSELVGGAAQVQAATDPLIGVMAPDDVRDRLVQGQTEASDRLMREGVVLNNDLGDALRSAGRAYRPDPATASTAEQLLYGFARGASKITVGALAGGPLGIVAMGGEEGISAADDLARQGVPFRARSAAGAVQGGGLALAALPLVGGTLKQTAALYLAGGPGGYMAQQALTRQILEDAGQKEVAAQFDPFDPVGLAVSALLPAGFTAYGLRAQRLKRAHDSLPAEMPREPGPPAAEPPPVEPLPSARTAVAGAVDRYATEQLPRFDQETVDAAMVMHLVERARAAEDGAALAAKPEDVQAAVARATELDAGIAALEAQRAELLPTAADLAEPGAIREARQELRLMEQTRVDTSDAAIRAAAKEIQARERISYKAALSEARKQVEAAAADWQAKANRIEAFIERNADAQKASQQVQRIDAELQTLREEVAATSPVVQWARELAARAEEVRSSDQFKAFYEATRPEPEAPAAKPPEPAGEQITLADGTPARVRDMTPDERAAVQREVIDLRKRAALLKALQECIA